MPESIHDTEKTAGADQTTKQQDEEPDYPSWQKRTIIMLSTFLSLFLVTLVRTHLSSLLEASLIKSLS